MSLHPFRPTTRHNQYIPIFSRCSICQVRFLSPGSTARGRRAIDIRWRFTCQCGASICIACYRLSWLYSRRMGSRVLFCGFGTVISAYHLKPVVSEDRRIEGTASSSTVKYVDWIEDRHVGEQLEAVTRVEDETKLSFLKDFSEKELVEIPYTWKVSGDREGSTASEVIGDEGEESPSFTRALTGHMGSNSCKDYHVEDQDDEIEDIDPLDPLSLAGAVVGTGFEVAREIFRFATGW
ncbi:hypothetical protein BJ508DRAFT_349436 [Ascobolus immersus RN42]|uniref:Uncharacterized protein n=1 Tax=Ascobolus immersus RN42 TaxID=1160509 RepID=A0A3N4I2R0_ASCIM|nr:hypothetical protein BJ508DRAFT_349436 [Ascobolus immersus RN42]